MTTPTHNLPAARASLTTLRDQMRAAFIERTGEIDAILMATIAGEHVLLVGPWGTAKSQLANALAKGIDSTSYSILLTKHTTPEEPFGPLDLNALDRGEYRRITKGRFPEAEVAFLDEIFKSSSAILNGFLTALNEREFDNGGQRQPIPLKVCVAASNELPQDEGLGALFDRFLFRRWTPYVKDRDNRRRLLMMKGNPIDAITAKLSPADLDALRAARASVDYTDVVEPMLDLAEALAAEGIEVSDRRWRKCVKVVQASAVLNGRDKATTADLMPLADALWDDPEDYGKVFGCVAKFVSPDLEKALQLQDAAIELWSKKGLATADLGSPAGLATVAESQRELKRIHGQLQALRQDGAVAEATAKVGGMVQNIARRMTQAVAAGF